MTLRFVRAEEADIPLIYSQAKALIDEYEDISAINYEKVLHWVENKIRTHISQYCCVLAENEKCAFYRLCDDGELDDLYVLPAFQSRGIGAEILKKCIEDSGGFLYLYVFSRNTRAISFYRRFGFFLREAVGTTRLIMERKG